VVCLRVSDELTSPHSVDCFSSRARSLGPTAPNYPLPDYLTDYPTGHLDKVYKDTVLIEDYGYDGNDNRTSYQQANELQRELRDATSPATAGFFWFNYGIDICDALTPRGGPDGGWRRRAGKRGEYDSIWNDIMLDPSLLSDPELFKATLLHELVHWASDVGDRAPLLDPGLEALVADLRAASRSDLSKAFSRPGNAHLPADVGEYIQFGDLITLGRGR